ncbi:BolA-like protein 3 [Hondaea fermentalgiana]|uniref:BolA-like protein 3 n=1 Tax=Hondaea fermentalgiana TaxID=2315210 RepID=A0A2R5GTJ0_9STRA|nr:BolA-like protein 3 [Hondaea fermentalgiana]|eukprot:GBG33895.1 BolA-like protein 3 [Hondaea fermentalgiana]
MLRHGAMSLNAVLARSGAAAPAWGTRAAAIQTPQAVRMFSDAAAGGSSKEQEMKSLLEAELQTSEVLVEDVSGGCGSAYNVSVTSPLFEGKNKVQQARLVYKILDEHIKEMHSINVNTAVPKK